LNLSAGLLARLLDDIQSGIDLPRQVTKRCAARPASSHPSLATVLKKGNCNGNTGQSQAVDQMFRKLINKGKLLPLPPAGEILARPRQGTHGSSPL
jgi:hypothetical protein